MFSESELERLIIEFKELKPKLSKHEVTVRDKAKVDWVSAVGSYSWGLQRCADPPAFIVMAAGHAAKIGNYIKRNIDRGGRDESSEKITVSFAAMCGRGPCGITYQFGGRFGDGYVLEVIGFKENLFIASGLGQSRPAPPSFWEVVFADPQVPEEVRRNVVYDATHRTRVSVYSLEQDDDVTKIAGEGARWVAVREAFAAGKLNDDTFFYVPGRYRSEDGRFGVYFDDLWKDWMSFKKAGHYFDIPNSALIRYVQDCGRFQPATQAAPTTNWRLS